MKRISVWTFSVAGDEGPNLNWFNREGEFIGLCN